MFKEASISCGMNFVCSRADYKSVTEETESEILDNIVFIEKRLISHFAAMYWSHYQLEVILPTWESKSDKIEENVQKVASVHRATLKSAAGTCSETFQLLNSFEKCAQSHSPRLRIVPSQSPSQDCENIKSFFELSLVLI